MSFHLSLTYLCLWTFLNMYHKELIDLFCSNIQWSSVLLVCYLWRIGVLHSFILYSYCFIVYVLMHIEKNLKINIWYEKKRKIWRKKRKPKIGIYLCKDLYVHHRFERLTHYTIVSNTLWWGEMSPTMGLTLEYLWDQPSLWETFPFFRLLLSVKALSLWDN